MRLFSPYSSYCDIRDWFKSTVGRGVEKFIFTKASFMWPTLILNSFQSGRFTLVEKFVQSCFCILSLHEIYFCLNTWNDFTNSLCGGGYGYFLKLQLRIKICALTVNTFPSFNGVLSKDTFWHKTCKLLHAPLLYWCMAFAKPTPFYMHANSDPPPLYFQPTPTVLYDQSLDNLILCWGA